MVRHELQTSILRFYKEETTDPFADYDGVCTLIWENKDTVWIKGLHGEVNLRLLKQMIAVLHSHGVKTIKSYRAGKRNLPFLKVRDGTYAEIEVADIIKRMPDILTMQI